MIQSNFSERLVDTFVHHLKYRDEVSVIADDCTIWTGYQKPSGRIYIVDEEGIIRIIVGCPGEEHGDIQESLDWDDSWD